MKAAWWKESVIYQIYPRSFKDSNGDGIGDLGGIVQKIGYLKKLGIDVVWLSPIFKSPNDDNGYDVSDYCDIMEEFGTMSDFDRLLFEIHQNGMKLILDLVPNHTSDEHRWFRESRKSKDNPYRDYYYWRSEKPSNWTSFFSGSAWELDELTEEYYLHLFSKKQPDLNWENPKVRQEIYQIMRFWFDKGVDGFRIDVLPFISKRLDFPDIDPANFAEAIVEVYANGPRLHEYLREMNQEACAPYDIMTMGEGIGVKPENVLEYVGEDRAELNMLYHFDHVTINYGPGGKYDPVDWKLTTFKKIFADWDKALQNRGWITIVLDNHDFPRMVSRFGNDGEYRVASSKLLATLLLTMRGSPCIYQGSEIGMTNVKFDSLDAYDDVEVVNLYQEWLAAGKDPAPLLKAVQIQGRDNARTPMQWNNKPYGGFSESGPWLTVNPNFTSINVDEALADPHSIFYHFQRLIAFRRRHPTLIYGDYETLMPESEHVYAYRRWDADAEFYVLLNFSDDLQPFELEVDPKELELVVSNYDLPGQDQLLPWEARILRKKAI